MEKAKEFYNLPFWSFMESLDFCSLLIILLLKSSIYPYSLVYLSLLALILSNKFFISFSFKMMLFFSP